MAKKEGPNLTKVDIEALEPKAAMYRLPAGGCKGLVLQVTPAGVMSWMLRFRMDGHQVNHTLENGQWPGMTVSQARKAGLALWGRIGKGENPAGTKRAKREAQTVSQLVTQFRKEHLDLNLKPSTKAEYERLIQKRILPTLGTKKVKDIQPSDVAKLLSKIRADTPKGIEANRTRAVLSKMFTLGALWGFCPTGSNPAKGQTRAPETKKDRHLSDKELLSLGDALRHLDPTPEGEDRPLDALPEENLYALAAVRLALLTGLRKSEIIGDKKREIPALTWASVDLEAARIELTHHKTARKAGTRMVPLCSAACELLEHLPRVLTIPETFCVIPGGVAGEALVNLQTPWERVRDAVGTLQARAKVPKKDRVDVTDVTIHDLRRSFASLGARMGYPDSFIGALLGHAAGSVTAGYARVGFDPLRDAVEVIGARMAGLLSGLIDLEAEAKAAKDQAMARRAGISA